MKTESYNPSKLEVAVAKSLTRLKDELEMGFTTNKIVGIDASLELDNPIVTIKTQDEDGDHHELVIKVIQRPDNF